MPPGSDFFHLPELIVARALHDVGGLSGTLAATLELAVEEAGAGAGENLTAAAETAADLNRRVRLLRAAWGPAETGLDPARLQDLALGVPGVDRMRLDLSALPLGSVFSPALSQVLLNLVLLAAESLPRGGTLALAEAAGNGTALVALISGPRATWPEGFGAMLGDEAAARAAIVGPRNLTAPLLALLARALGVRLSLLMPARKARRRGPPPLLIEAE